MKHVKLTIELSDELHMKSVDIMYNDTDLESDSNLIKMLAFTLLKSFSLNKEDVMLQDLLNKIGIKS